MVVKRHWRVARWLADTALLSFLGACGGAQRPPLATTQAEALNLVLYEASHPCASERPATTALDEPAPEVLVEVVLLGAPLRAKSPTPDDLQRLADNRELRLLGTPKLSGHFDATTTLKVEEHFGVLDQPTLSRISLTPRRGEGNHVVLELAVGVSLPNADPAKNPALADTSFVLEAAYGQPALGIVRDPGDPKRQLIAVLNAYPIRSNDDRRTFFECKMRLHQRALEAQ